MKQIYTPKNNNPKELYRNFIMIYYYLLLNNKPTNYYKKILKYFYKDNASTYYNFFNENFYNYQNIFFFTLYNQLPLEFLPLPDSKLYLNYPLITFSNKDTFFLECESPINLSKKFMSNNILDIGTNWKSLTFKDIGNTANKKLTEIKPDIKEYEQEQYDNFHIIYNTKLIKNLNKTFLKDKILFLFVDNPIICLKYNFTLEKINIYTYYKKINFNKYIKIKKQETYYLKDIKYICFYKNIVKDDIYKCFNNNKLVKDTNLYHQVNAKYYNASSYESYIPKYFTIDPNIRIHDPLRLENNKYIVLEFKLIKEIDILNITSSIYFNNEITNKNFNKYKNDLLKCYKLDDDIENNFKFCDYDFVNPNLKIWEINYNKKNALLLIIWKNKKIIDREQNFIPFLLSLGIKSYFNQFSLIKNKNKIELLGEEFFISESNCIIKSK